MRKVLFFILVSIAVASSVGAQDRFFTQFFSNQVDLNPALTGGIDGNFRVALTYRDQWRGFIDSPYATYGVYGDLRFAFNRKQRTSGDYIGVGLGFTADKAKVYDLNSNAVLISGAYHKSLNRDQSEYLSAGFYFGINQRNVNYESLTFEDQFNGLNGYTFGTSETLPENNFAHGDFGIGVHYTTRPSKDFRLSGGISIAHIFEPSISFFARTPRFEEESRDFVLNRKLALYVSSEILLSETSDLLPRLLFLNQGPDQLLFAGSSIKFDINDFNNNALHLGGGLRFVRNLDSFGLAALVAQVGYEMENFLIGLSYDYNMDDLINDRNGQGIFEISLRYIGQYENEGAFCPSF